jgi:hypothetical protein
MALLEIDPGLGTLTCAATDTDIACDGVVVSVGASLGDAAAGGVAAAVYIDGSEAYLAYKTPSMAAPNVLSTATSPEGRELWDFGRIEVCARQYAVAKVACSVDELVRIDDDGMHFLTDFASLAGDTSLEGEVPDDIRDFGLGHNCDAIL